MRQQKEALDKLGLMVKVITFDAGVLALAYVKETDMQWPLIEDSEQLLYAKYGLTRAGWWNIYGLPSICQYLAAMFRGFLPGKPGKDWRQLGGDVLIDPQGIVRLLHVSRSPHDRPSVESILAMIQDEVTLK
ncbi:MAG: AhpC/TSA family protein [Rubripirellula sp.]